MINPTAAVVVVSRSEPVARLRRLFDACAQQTVPCEVYIAAPPDDLHTVREASEEVDLRVHHIPNTDGRRSRGLNLAVRSADADIVCRLDARTRPPVTYVEDCLRVLEDSSIGMVGGVQRPVAGSEGAIARGIARALANPYAVGAPAYRVGSRSGPVDTVYLGAFRRQEFLDLGGYAQDLEANEDFELASRFRRKGLLVWLDATMVHDYEARSTLPAVLAQYRAFGRSKFVYWRRTGSRPNARQAAALAGVPFALAALIGSRSRRRIGLSALAAVTLVDHLVERTERSVWTRGVAVVVEMLLPVVWVGGVMEEAVRGKSDGGRGLTRSLGACDSAEADAACLLAEGETRPV